MKFLRQRLQLKFRIILMIIFSLVVKLITRVLYLINKMSVSSGSLSTNAAADNLYLGTAILRIGVQYVVNPTVLNNEGWSLYGTINAYYR